MNHLSEGVLQAFLDGEVAAAERARVAAHLEQCTSCAAELETLRADARLFSAALVRLDVPVQLAEARAATARRVTGRPIVIRLLRPATPRGAELRRAFLRAAVLVLVVAGAASATVPGSPVRRIIAQLWHQTTHLFTRSRPAPLAPPVSTAPAPAPAPSFAAGVSVLPQDGRVRILVHSPAPGLSVHVRLLDTDRATVEASGKAANARFRTGPGRIEVADAGAGLLLIELPRSVRHAFVEVDGKPLFTKNGDQIQHAAAVQADGDTVFRLHP